MSDTLLKSKLKVLITGPLPPPAGGISIHIHRLHHMLQHDFDFDFIDESSNIKSNYFNIRSLNVFRYLNVIRKADILFIHSGNRFFKKLHIILGKIFRKRMIITIHGYGLKRRFPFNKLDSLVYSMPDKIIIVNEDILSRVKLPVEKCIVKHAFLPPIIEEEPLLPQEITDCIRKSGSENRILIAANASRLNTHNNQDLYGLDMCVELALRLEKKNIKATFVYTVSSLDQGKDRYDNACKFINDNGLQNNFMLLNMNISFVKLIEQCDIVLRPTNTDGDALTIREGLELGKIVLASDVVERPDGTYLFKNRDIDDMENKITELIQLIRKGKAGTITNKTQNISNHHVFYRKLILDVMNVNA